MIRIVLLALLLTACRTPLTCGGITTNGDAGTHDAHLELLP